VENESTKARPQRERGDLAGSPRWKFGAGQTLAEERAEIRVAKQAGRAEEYIRGQRWRQMVDAERTRRRNAKADRRAAARAAS
jgi:hypothetical protein